MKHQNPNLCKVRKYPFNAWKNACKTENKWKRKGIMDIPALGEENPAKHLSKTTKNWGWCLSESEREKGVLKSDLNKSNLTFKKACSRFLIDWKLVSIDQKTDWINRNSKKNRIF